MFVDKKILWLVSIVIVFVTAGCGTKTSNELSTPAGPFEIEEVQLTDRFPPDCVSGSVGGCSVAKSGYQVLIVWVAPPEEFEGNLKQAMTAEKPYVSLEDGSQLDFAISGIASQRYFLAFTPPSSETNFTLHWPDNPPIELEQYLEK